MRINFLSAVGLKIVVRQDQEPKIKIVNVVGHLKHSAVQYARQIARM